MTTGKTILIVLALFMLSYIALSGRKSDWEGDGKMTGEEYVKMQDMWLKATDIKKGDWVKVTRKADSHESGWNNVWTPDLDTIVGTFVRVVGVRDSNGIEVGTSNFSFPSCRLPFFILEPAKKPKPEKYQFTPFEQVLVRDEESDKWRISLFERRINDKQGFDFGCINGFFGYDASPTPGMSICSTRRTNP